MRRRILHRVVVYGLVGLVVNVLVAWGFAAWGSVGTPLIFSAIEDDPDSLAIHDPGLEWSVSGARLTGRPLLRFVSDSEGLCVIAESSGANLSAALRMPERKLKIARFGWPVAALMWHEVEESGVVVDRGRWIDLPGAGPVTKPLITAPRRLPLEPVWAGLILNTAICGGALAGGIMDIWPCASRRS